MSMPSRHILGMRVDSGTYQKATDRIQAWSRGAESRYVCVSNVHMTMETVDSDAFRNVVNSADMVTSDGMPLVWMLRRLGLPDSERVYGPELVLHVCAMAERERIPIGLYGGTDDSLERFTAFLAERYPALEVAYRHAPPFRPLTDEEDQDVVDMIRKSGARILFVGIGCPKQEKWMAAHKDRLPVVQIGVGAAFDFHSGAVKQAPAWMGRSGLEWLYRLMMEPRRLWKRYVLLNPRFMVRAGWQLMRHRFRPTAAHGLIMLLLASFLLAMTGPATGSEPTGRTIHVDLHHPSATDRGPGTTDRPFRTISGALASGLVGPADTVLVAGGLYREELNPQIGGSGPDARVVIKGRVGEDVVISGADRIETPPRRQGSLWVIDNYVPLDYFGDDHTYERELAIVDGHALRPVFNHADLVPGTFFVERLSPISSRVWLDTGSTSVPSVEMAQRGALFFPGNPYAECGEPGQPEAFHLIGLTFRHAANAAQFGAVCLGGSDSVLEDVTVEETVGTGIQVIGSRLRLTRVVSNHNGQTGINGRCITCTISDSQTSYNNFVGHDPFWEAGGGKWSESYGVQFIRHTSVGNDGPGLWFDGNNAGLTVSFGRFEDNLAAGIFIELLSEDITVERVTVRGTRRLGWSGAGILVQAAGTATLRDNLITENEGAGIWLRRDSRSPSGYNTIQRNHLTGNGRVPGQDHADLQIGADSMINLCSNQLVENDLGQDGSFLFEVDETGESYHGHDLDHFQCLVDYSNR